MQNSPIPAWKGTWLIQALNAPRKTGHFKVNPFAFGGGGSGLKKETAEMLEEIWSPEYMGAAEYEFGAFTEALQQIVAHKDAKHLVAKVVQITGPVAAKSDNCSWYSKGPSKAKTFVYIIGNAGHLANIVAVIDSLLNGTEIPQPYGGPAVVRLKSGICLWDALFSPAVHNGDVRFQGGLELDNGWFVFTNVEMFRKVCAMFDIHCPEDQINALPQYVPPKGLLSNETVDRKILHAFKEAGISHDFISLCAIVYDIDGAVGKVLPDEQMPLAQHVEKRIRSLLRSKFLIKNPKTKRLTVPPKENACPSPS